MQANAHYAPLSARKPARAQYLPHFQVISAIEHGKTAARELATFVTKLSVLYSIYVIAYQMAKCRSNNP